MNDRSLSLSFFWHMHQPDYRGSDGVMSMPWVFLHAIKDYYEMPWLMSQYPGLKATFNLSASLIEQLKLYTQPLKYDYFLSLWVQHPSKLSQSQQEWLIKLCTAMQYDTMVHPIARYCELYEQTLFSDDELIDLEVVFLLAWCGNTLRLHNDLVKALFIKQRGYTQEDKTTLLETLTLFVSEILPFYGRLQKEGTISVSTTPYFHPILPLLIDMENGQRANGATELPEGAYSLRDDAIEHVERSIKLYETTFGTKPSGFWPAEGAVDEKSLAIYKEHGISWIATDEAILHKSLHNDASSLRYKPYRYEDVTIAFRDHGLSDLIGFEYRHMEGKKASSHFMDELHRIASNEENPNVFVIVDGENAWEFYPNNGWDFFTSLYSALSTSTWCKTASMDEVSQKNESEVLEHLAPGSWIHGTFDTWVGHREKNRAWELIFETRREVERYAQTHELTETIRYHLLASQCSDWFWWYGEDHVTEFSSEFDTLFRDHLIEIYHLMEKTVPSHFREPINSFNVTKPSWIKPKNSISPRLGGEKRSFFEWIGCGMVDETQSFSTMDRLRGPVDTIYYGLDDQTVYIALEGKSPFSLHTYIEMVIEETGERLVLKPVAFDHRLEFSLSRTHFGSNTVVHLRWTLMEENQALQTLPGNGTLLLELNNYFTTDWFI